MRYNAKPFPCPTCGENSRVIAGCKTKAGYKRWRFCDTGHGFTTLPDENGNEVVCEDTDRRGSKQREPVPEFERDFISEPAVFDTAGLIHFLYGAYRAGHVSRRLPRYVHEYAQEVRAMKAAA